MNNPKKEIYVDACATTPPLKEVVNKISEISNKNWANPSSNHKLGIKAADSLERSRRKIAILLNSESEDLIFTSGATESIQLAILGSAISLRPGRIVISNVEHPAVKTTAYFLERSGWEVKFWPVDKFGCIDITQADQVLESPTKIVSIIWAQSEIGTIQSINTISNLCRKRNIIFHTDATQMLSQGLFDWKNIAVDLLSASAHKIQGPKGVGLLLKRDKNLIRIFDNIKQENGYRAGTEPVQLIAGMATALEFLERKANGSNEREIDRVEKLTQKLKFNLKTLDNIIFTGHDTKRLKNHISFLVLNKHGKPILGSEFIRQLSKRGVYASTGSACQSGNLQDSDVLSAIGINQHLRKSGIRLSLGPWLCKSDIDHISDIVEDTIISFS